MLIMRRWKQIYFIGVGYILVNELLVGSNLLKKINNASQWIKEDLISQHDTLKKSVQNEAIAQNLYSR
jgi:hypothetical protein